MTPESSLAELMNQWRDLGIELWTQDDRLRFRAPRGVMTPEVTAQIKARKPEILAALDAATSGPTPAPAEATEPFPLTDVQGAYLMGRSDLFADGGVSCHLYCEFEVPVARLDAARARAAWHTLVERHAALRTVFDATGFQRVLPQEELGELEIPVVTVGAGELEERRRAVRSRLDHELRPVGAWPMESVEFTCVPETDTVIMHVSHDFLVCDWSGLQQLVTEWYAEYSGQPGAAGPPTPELSFRDFCVWQANQRGGKRRKYREDREYWLGRLPELPAAPQLPVHSAESAAADSDGTARWAGHAANVPADRWRSFQEAAAGRNVTPSAALMALYGEVLSRWAQDPKLSLNLTVMGKPAGIPELATVVGDFTTVSILGVHADARPFEQRAQETAGQLAEDLEHSAFTGVDVIRELGTSMPYVFTSALGTAPADGHQQPQPRVVYSLSQTPQAYLDCQVSDDATGLHIHFDHLTSALPEPLVANLLEAFQAAIECLAADPSAWGANCVVELPSRDREEREAANRTDRDVAPGLLHSGFLEQAARRPDAVAVIAEDGTWTYGELLQRASGIAQAVAEALEGTAPRRVLVAVQPGARLVAAELGVLMAGAEFIPVNTAHPAARVETIRSTAAARLVLTAGEAASATPQSSADGVRYLDVDTLPAATTPLRGAAQRRPEDTAYVIFTSGSTGTPKGVDIAHDAAWNTVVTVNERLGVGPEDRLLALANPSFDLAIYDVFGALAAGAAIVVPPYAPEPTPTQWARTAVEHGATRCNTVPAVAGLIATAVEQGAPRPERLRSWIMSGDRIPPELVGRLRAQFPDVDFISMGGATEAAIWSIAHDVTAEDAERAVPYGTPLPNQRWAVLDALGRDVPAGVPGDLVILGRGLARGYLGQPELTAAAFPTDPRLGRCYRTGDRGMYLPGGELAILGRSDDQVKIRGHRIELGEVERGIAGLDGVASAAAAAGGEGESRRLCAAVVLQPGRPSSPEAERELAARLRDVLPEPMIPQAWLLTDALPLTGNGKVDRKTIAAEALVQRGTSEEGVQADGAAAETQGAAGAAPATESARRLAGLWADRLGLPSGEPLAGNADPFALGANSITAAGVAGDWRGGSEEVSFETMLRILLSAPSVQAAADELDAAVASVRGRPEDTADAEGTEAAGQPAQAWLSAAPLRVRLHELAAREPSARSQGLQGGQRADGAAPSLTVLLGDDLTDPFRLSSLASRLGEAGARSCAAVLEDPSALDCEEAEAATLVPRIGVAVAAAVLGELGDGADRPAEVRLVGYSFGARVAIEAARVLLERGVRVHPLALIDPPLVPGLATRGRLAEMMHLTAQGVDVAELGVDLAAALKQAEGCTSEPAWDGEVARAFAQLSALDDAARWARYAEVAAPNAVSPRDFRRHLAVMRACGALPQPVLVDAALAQPQDPTGFVPGAHDGLAEQFRSVLLGEVRVARAPGHHFQLCSAEFARSTADALQ